MSEQKLTSERLTTALIESRERLRTGKPALSMHMETILLAWEADEAELARLRELAIDLVEVAQAKIRNPATPNDGFLGRAYWQGQKDTARKFFATTALEAGEEQQGGA